MIHICPDIPDSWKGGPSAVARLLQISRTTLLKYSSLGSRAGGIDWHVNKSRKKVYTGKEVKRFWQQVLT